MKQLVLLYNLSKYVLLNYYMTYDPPDWREHGTKHEVVAVTYFPTTVKLFMALAPGVN